MTQDAYGIDVPSAYRLGYAEARKHNQSLADNYIKHTRIGDPELDSILDELSSVRHSELHRFIEGGIEQDESKLKDAPLELRQFFYSLDTPPEWVDKESFVPGIRVFHANVDLMLTAFVTGVLIEGFSTLIAKSFNTTKRTASTRRRLKQNNRQMLEIFYPGGLDRTGDGWKLSARVRFVHARIRNLLLKSEYWDYDSWGMPLSAAHLGFAISIFSKRMVDFSMKVGAKYTEVEKRSVIDVWRYAGYLMGIPEAILFKTIREAEEMFFIGHICEPPPDHNSIEMANVLIRTIPHVVGIEDPIKQKELEKLAYRLSRAFIGNQLADSLEFPKSSTLLTLFVFQLKEKLKRFRKGEQHTRSANFSSLIDISAYEEFGLSYRMPSHVLEKKSIDW